MKIRKYKSGDCGAMAKLFYDTVHSVNAKDYTKQQLDAWATGTVDEKAWDAAFREHDTMIAECDGEIVGFGDMTEDGYLDRLYVHKDFQRRGIGTVLCDFLERGCGAPAFRVHASITARPFFEAQGYTVVKKQQVTRGGVALTNFVMEK
ncbi:MAG: GNAT family N-acetyltransferase [Oscillospiraceae bacterium]|nr:GNAT family N-acetyltransferase [Oscillospiraceae bacterium]